MITTDLVSKFDKSKYSKDMQFAKVLIIYLTNEVFKFVIFINFKFLQL